MSKTEYISKQFHGQDSLFIVMKFYEKAKQNNVSNMVCVCVRLKELEICDQRRPFHGGYTGITIHYCYSSFPFPSPQLLICQSSDCLFKKQELWAILIWKGAIINGGVGMCQ